MTFTKEQHREYASKRGSGAGNEEGRYTKEDHERYRAEVDAREKEERERQTATAEKAAAKRSWLVSEILRATFSASGTTSKTRRGARR